MSAPDDMMADWQALARQSWDAWTDGMRQAGAVPGHATPGGDAGDDAVERTLEGLKGYFRWMQMAAAHPGSADAGDWSDWLRRSFAQAGNGLDGAFAGMAGNGAQGFDALMRQWTNAAAPFAGQARSWLQLPAFGFGREQQEQQQREVQAMLDWSQQFNRYQAVIARANLLGVEYLERKLAERAEPGRQVESLRALYDLWVDAAEEAYAEVALTPEFREVYGALVNAQMRVRSLQQKRVEQLSREAGLPTRSEVNSLGERLQALRRDVRKLGGTDLAAEVEALRKEVAALRKSAGPANPARAPAKRAGAAAATPARAARPKTKAAAGKPTAKRSARTAAKKR
jgi:polyhydroxyalkanoate synthesis regulator phasin